MTNKAVRLEGKVIGILNVESRNLGYFHSDTPDSPFSNMYMSKDPFIMYQGKSGMVYYNHDQLDMTHDKVQTILPFRCMEQAFAFGKAVLMDDYDMSNKILFGEDGQGAHYKPFEYKKLGRQVKNFDADLWKDKAPDWIKQCMRAKFTQDIFCKRALELTKYYNLNLVECNPYDRTWGAGKSIKNDFSAYPGQNQQGKLLTEVRDSLFKNS